MGVADAELGQPPVAPHSSQPFVRRGIAWVQRERAIEMAIRRIEHASLTIVLRQARDPFAVGAAETRRSSAANSRVPRSSVATRPWLSGRASTLRCRIFCMNSDSELALVPVRATLAADGSAGDEVAGLCATRSAAHEGCCQRTTGAPQSSEERHAVLSIQAVAATRHIESREQRRSPEVRAWSCPLSVLLPIQAAAPTRHIENEKNREDGEKHEGHTVHVSPPIGCTTESSDGIRAGTESRPARESRCRAPETETAPAGTRA